MNDVRELMKEAELVELRPVAFLARMAAGPFPEQGKEFENHFDVKTGFVRSGEKRFTVIFRVDCDSKRTKEEPAFARFQYRLSITYQTQRDWADELLQQYALTNAAVHAWPYARQFIQSASTQLGLSAVVLPALRLGQPPAGASTIRIGTVAAGEQSQD